MDSLFYFKQGQILLERRDPKLLVKALQQFIKANRMTNDYEVGKVQVLYQISMINLLLGRHELAYKIAYKAKKILGLQKSLSTNVKNNLHTHINEIIESIKQNYPIDAFIIDKSGNYTCDENHIDFSLIINSITDKILPEFLLEDIKDDLLFITFFGMCRTDEDLIFFDKQCGDILNYEQGYFLSRLENETVKKRQLVAKIENKEPLDFVDEERYILLPQISLFDFLNEIRKNANNKIVLEFINYFETEVKKHILSSGVAFKEIKYDLKSNEIFLKQFSECYNPNIPNLSNQFSKIYETTIKKIAYRWIKESIFSHSPSCP